MSCREAAASLKRGAHTVPKSKVRKKAKEKINRDRQDGAAKTSNCADSCCPPPPKAQ